MNPSLPIQVYAGRQIDRLLTQLAKDLKRTQTHSEPDPIHDLRVSIRRFSQALRLFRDFVPEAELKPVRKLLKQMMDLTSEIRNRDIAVELIADSKNNKLETTTSKGPKGVRRALQPSGPGMERGERPGKVAKCASGALMNWTSNDSTSDNAVKRLPALAAKYFQAGRKAVKNGRPAADLHSFRVKTKQFRYALELFRPVYGAPLEQKLEALHDIQKILGQISDIYTTRDLLKSDPKRRKQMDRRGEKKIGKFQDEWKQKFDAGGELKSWKKFLSAHLADNLGQAVSTPKPRKRS